MDQPIRDALARLAVTGQVIEVRALGDTATHSGYFNDPALAVRAVEPLDTDPSVAGIYVTLNEVNPALQSRRANRIKMRLSKKDSTTSDADIQRRRWLPIDIDPVRPSGVSSTDVEHTLAQKKAEGIFEWLAGLGFPDPIRADSGNGAHLLYRIDLPNDAAATALVKGCLATLDLLFSDERVSVDTANYNAGRIWKLYGTISRKGDSTPERPHRRSRILSAPDVPEVVSAEQLRALTSRLPMESQAAQPPAAPKGARFELRSWLSEHDISARSEKPFGSGTLFALEVCPFSEAHRDGAFAIQFGNGGIFAGCKHASCGGGTQRWQELRERFEPDRAAKRKVWEQKLRDGKKKGAKAKAEREGSMDPSQSANPDHQVRAENENASAPQHPADPDLRAQALDLLAHGDPLALMLDTFAENHVGDEILARCMVYSMASQAVKNSQGLHVSVTGESGKGKTHAFKKMMRQVPERYKIKGTMSDKALFYKKDLRPGTVLSCDDTALSDNIQEILKSATSSFDEPIVHSTVTKDLTPRVCTIPERCVWWIAKKEGTGDDQVANRMLTCWIDESAEQDARVIKAKQEKEKLDPDTFVDETPGLLTCREIWEILHEQQIWVIIPFALRVHFHSISNRRNPDMLYDLIKSHAVLSFMQRDTKTAKDGTLCVYANEADFCAANEVFTQLNGTAGGQESKMTKKEADLLGVIERVDKYEFTIQDLQRLTGWSHSIIHKIMKGYDSRGKNYTGLLEKCPAISFTDRTVTTEEEDGLTVRRRAEAFQWDKELFLQWNRGGSCWLDRDPKDDGGNNDGAGSNAAVGSTTSDTREDAGKLSCGIAAPCGNFAEISATKTVAAAASDSIKETNNKNLVLKESYLRKNRINVAGNSVTDVMDPPVDPVSCDSAISATENRSPQISYKSENTTLYNPRLVAADAAKLPQLTAMPHTGTKQDRVIRVRDYKPLTSPEPKSACYTCGKEGAWYVEKLTPERRARRHDEQNARRICRMCYKEAGKTEQMAAVPLPGMIDVSRFTRVTHEIGRCSVCGMEKAIWTDPATSVLLCEHCYGREVRGQMSAARQGV
ncbi:MAG: hypothetical protein NTV84_05635 [Methanoregula sp.]|nr:hypothetical protein [Methanoregula sp.]